MMHINIYPLYTLLLVLYTLLSLYALGVQASSGDNNVYFQKCVQNCRRSDCTNDGLSFLRPSEISIFVRYLWSCDDDCHYHCMWDTIKSFKERSWNVPQFHGKWPFIRILGLQEPASVLFSVFNFISHFIMIRKFRQEVRPTSPTYYLWHLYALVCMNGWVWSSVFHARDVPITEKMDYFSAFCMVLFSFYSMILRLLQGRYTIVAVLLTIFCVLFFIHHVTYLLLVHFDYSYNMLANVAVGAVTTLGWIMWACLVRKQQPYVWRCAAFSVLTGLCVCFEVIDFPPVLWTIDAHALFHLGTAGLPVLFYRFLIDDCKYLLKQVELARDETFTRKKQ